MYDTWVPKPDEASNSNIVDGYLLSDTDSNRNLRILDQTSPDAARMYFTLAPNVSAQAQLENPIYVIQCALYNASWHVEFDVRSTGEQILTPSLAFKNWMPGWSSINPPLMASKLTNTILDYAGLMETFGAITNGRLDSPNDPNLPFTQTSLALETSPILFADAFPDLFTDAAMVKLERTFESLFQNMTLSARYAVLPQQDLRGDTQLLTFVGVNATSMFARNVYAYNSRDLVIPYTLAVVGSAACILLAMLAIRDMGAVYSNSFSTAVRVTRSQNRLDNVIQDDRDRSGAQPLPKRVADAYIWIGREQKVGMGMGRGRVGTDESAASSRREGRSWAWWEEEKKMDLEKRPGPGKGPLIVVTEKGGEEGGWI